MKIFDFRISEHGSSSWPEVQCSLASPPDTLPSYDRSRLGVPVKLKVGSSWAQLEVGGACERTYQPRLGADRAVRCDAGSTSIFIFPAERAGLRPADILDAA
jgi:hypothetical protein